MIKGIFFDLDDTLLWDSRSIAEAFQSTCLYASEKVDLDPEQLEINVRIRARELYSSYETYKFTKMIGINPFEGLWGDFDDDHHEQFSKLKELVPSYREEAWTQGLTSIGINDRQLGKELAEYFRKERKKRPYVYEDTFYILDALKDKYDLMLLTNGSPQLQNTKLGITPELQPYFKEIIISGKVGRGKPETEMFQQALESISLQNDEVIMVGDNLMTDILGASRMGIKTVWVNRENKKLDKVIPDYEISQLRELLPLISQWK
ncbi:HAD family hydrolase [Rossellomorea aquimaris]|uniref:HAD family hydrolase n=1 Tax=Rossellomorea aquimaris TaxID=189382 RepID=UPI0007D045BE|nr:HAD family hydrolase [Rossellomorea aquimaris]